MKKLLVAIMIGLTTVIAACSSGSSSRAEAFYQAIDQGQISEAVAMVEPSVVQQMKEATLRMALTKDAEYYKAAGGLKSISVKVEEHGELATSEVSITFGNGKTRNEKTKLVKVQGKWYVTV